MASNDSSTVLAMAEALLANAKKLEQDPAGPGSKEVRTAILQSALAISRLAPEPMDYMKTEFLKVCPRLSPPSAEFRSEGLG